ncbi:peptidoglycan DD-metalloendopeptidase family protein [bacterium]|nr:peptidoglycan DD-metalloendopeptidase family protein [bacterium]
MKVNLPISLLLILAFNLSYLNSSIDPQKSSSYLEKKEMLKEAEHEKSSLVEQLDYHDRQIVSLREEISRLELTEKGLLASQKELYQARQEAEEALRFSQTRLKEVLVETYKRGRSTELQFLLGSEDFSELFSRYKFLTLLAEKRNQKVSEAFKTRFLYDSLMAELDIQQQQITSTKARKEGKLEELLTSKTQFSGLLKDITRKEEEYRKALLAIQESMGELEDRAFGQSAYPGEFSRFKGELSWPTKGRSLIYSYGKITEKKYGTTFVNSGIDIKATADEEIFAVAEGEVVYVGWLRGYENVVVLKHGEGYFTLYGNLGRVEVSKGDTTIHGRRLGYVSSQGWTEGPKLHFEIRKGKEKENPLEWLRA